MTNINQVELAVITIVLSIFFVLLCVLCFFLIQFSIRISRISKKADNVITNLDHSVEVIKNVAENAAKKNAIMSALKTLSDSFKTKK